MKWFWLSFFGFLMALVVSAAIMRPDTVDSTLSYTGTFLVVTAWTLLGVVAVGAIVACIVFTWVAIHRQRLASVREVDGHYPLQRIKLRDGRIIIFDPNVMVSNAAIIDTRRGTIEEHEPAAGWHVQATIRALVERTRTAQAMYQGDASRSSKYGSVHRGERHGSVRALDVQPKPIALPTPPASAQLPAPATVREWAPIDALNANTRQRLVLGQSNGELIKWDLTEAPHLRFHGMTQGSGKTNAIKTAAAGAVRTGAHLVVLDRRRFKDWSDFRDCAELVDTRDPRAFAAAVTRLCTIYQERDAVLGQHGAPNIASLPQPPHRIVIVVSEFGALCATAQAEHVLDDVLYPLQLIMREAGAAGVHVLIEDQVVDQRWPRGISTNAAPVTGRLPLNYAAAGGYHYAHQLAPFTFHFNGQTFRTFDMRAALPVALAGYGRTWPNVVDSTATPVREGVRNERSDVFVKRSPEVDPSLEHRQTPTNSAVAIDRATWYDWALNYVASHPGLLATPPSGVRDMARNMARHATGSEENAGSYTGLASDLAKQLRAGARVPSAVGGRGAVAGADRLI